jgi:tetratricopeptide (TPR) repeat protein
MSEQTDPRVLLQQAVQLERAGRLDEAERAYLLLLSRWPDLPDTWYNLALLQKRAGRFEAALASYDQALARGVSQPEEVHLNRGVIYADCLRQDAAAEAALQKALALNPDYIPALLNLANLKEDLGQRDAALALYERILAREPQHFEALARCANVKRTTDPRDPVIARLQSALADPRAAFEDKASLGFALGKTLDQAGAYGPAFDAYTAANRASRRSAQGAALYDRKAHEAFVNELIATFTRESLVQAPVAGEPPIFICGMFRSGSTLIEQVLAAHPQVAAGGELPLLPTLVRNELAPFPRRMRQTSATQLEGYARRYLETMRRLFPQAARLTDKRPDNFLYIGLIKALFPTARIVHTTRHPLDNCLSIYFLHLDHSMAYALDLLDIAHYYVQQRRLMAHWRQLFGADILDLDYDAFVRAPRQCTETLLEFCALPWDERCMRFHEAAGAVKTASVWQVREPLYQRSSGRWRHYAAQLTPVIDYLREACPDVDVTG